MDTKLLKNEKRQNFLFNMEKGMVYGFFLFYLLASQIFLPYMKKREIFPIFQWSLFSKCDSNKEVWEMEVSYFEGDKETVITNRVFPSNLQNNFMHITHKIFMTKNRKEKEHFKNKLLYKISHFLNKKSFSYKIFESKVHLVEYAKKASIEKETLLITENFNLL